MPSTRRPLSCAEISAERALKSLRNNDSVRRVTTRSISACAELSAGQRKSGAVYPLIRNLACRGLQICRSGCSPPVRYEQPLVGRLVSRGKERNKGDFC